MSDKVVQVQVPVGDGGGGGGGWGLGKTILKFFLFALLVFLLYCGHEVINNRNPIPFMSKEVPETETKE